MAVEQLKLTDRCELPVPDDILSRLRLLAAEAHPAECCGLLLASGGELVELREADNVHPLPESHFEIDPRALIDAHRAARSGGPQVAGYYHSHPNGLARPSARDEAMAAGDGAIWAIVAAGQVTFWRAGDGGFSPLPYVIGPR